MLGLYLILYNTFSALFNGTPWAPLQVQSYEDPKCGPCWEPRVVIYHQTLHDLAGNSVSLLPLLREPHGPTATHIILAALHIGDPPHILSLNEHGPDDERYDFLWSEVRTIQATGVKVLAMLGGAAKGSFSRLDDSCNATFEVYYRPLRNFLFSYGLDGIDIDVEEDMSLFGIIRLIDHLRADFGSGFIITLAPAPEAMLHPLTNLSGFDYAELEVMRGHDIDWYNMQFYCGWGDIGNVTMFTMMVGRGWPADKLVVGMVTNPQNFEGWVSMDVSTRMMTELSNRFGTIGGVMGWEYFNSLPGGEKEPWFWASHMTAMMAQDCGTY